MFHGSDFSTEMNAHSCNVSQLVKKAYVDEKFRSFELWKSLFAGVEREYSGAVDKNSEICS